MATTSKNMMKEAKRFKERYQTIEKDNENECFEAWEDAFGPPFNPKEVQRARQDEVDYVHKMSCYTKILPKEAYQVTGEGAMFVRCVDINNGDAECPQLLFTSSGQRH